jgi:hypothetical protein
MVAAESGSSVTEGRAQATKDDITVYNIIYLI